ncbi:acyltransferase [Pseudonocardia yuanmonensis]|uniref:Acyltransferase n=1 Tax=Pseudonocardia yuanmonensis TaxID=1095914 RepID=A0ABP8WIM1_9PSEU
MTTTGAPASRTRLAHLDDLKVLMVAWVIGGHALLGYSAVGGWAYDELNEVTFTPGVEIGLVAVLGPSGLFVIGLFFFVAGLLTERAIHRHGPGPYVRDRLVRLGLPWLLSALLIWPLSVWVASVTAGMQVSPWWVFTHRDPFLDAGSLWFALVLLVFSIAFAGWTALHGGPPAPSGPLTGWHLAGATAAIAVATVVVRLVFPARSGQIADLHLWQWPQCLGMFLLGVVAARRGWAVHIPDPIRRACGWITVGVLMALPVLAVASGLHDVARDDGPYLGGWTWQAAATAAVEALLVTCGSIAFVGLAERRLHGAGPRARRWSRAAFAAFVVQGPVLMVTAAALRPLPVPAEVKAPVVAVVAIVVCFWLGGLWREAARRRREDRRASAADDGAARDLQ